jgi:hypothetical protein
MSRCHHSPRKYTRISCAILYPGSNPSVSLVWRQRKRSVSYILQGELRKIKPPNFNGENRKEEETETWLLEMKKYL